MHTHVAERSDNKNNKNKTIILMEYPKKTCKYYFYFENKIFLYKNPLTVELHFFSKKILNTLKYYSDLILQEIYE